MPACTVTNKDERRIAVLSGKGGTGKTLLAVNLAAVAGDAVYLDCDVEEPNGHLFFQPQNIETEAVNVKIPLVDAKRCDGCRQCVEFCRFHALAHTGRQLLIFNDICHSCGGCVLLCPQEALTEVDKTIGHVESGRSEQVLLRSGLLKPGEPSGSPIIRRLLELNQKDRGKTTLIDCPPGSACVVMESIQDADYCLLVAEPTLFGAHNLALVHELVRLFDKPHSVILNKCQPGENPSADYCREHDIPILWQLPYDHRLGRLHSDGVVAARADESYQRLFQELLLAVQKRGGS